MWTENKKNKKPIAAHSWNKKASDREMNGAEAGEERRLGESISIHVACGSGKD